MGIRYGRYEVLYKLGQGAMAQVFLARDPLLNRLVAVKVLHADLASRKDVLQRFFNEARTVAAVRSPHIVEIFDFGQEGKDLYLVMEFVDGLSLHGVLRRMRPPQPGSPDDQRPVSRHGREAVSQSEPLDPSITAALMCQAADGLAMAAHHGVVHRDIKPENLMINSQGYLKISDFGIAHVQDDSITKTGAVLGSPLFMSPEQARGLKPITSQADMFSLGSVFYSCLAGHPPFRGRTVTDLFRKIAGEAHVPLCRLRPDLDPVLANLVETLLHKHPADRGSGPRWLHRQLKSHLFALGVLDPADLICSHLKELSARGIQTTWRMERSRWGAQATLPIATLPMSPAATESLTRESDRRTPAVALSTALGFMVLVAAGIVWGLWQRAPAFLSPVRVPHTVVTTMLLEARKSHGTQGVASDASGNNTRPTAGEWPRRDSNVRVTDSARISWAEDYALANGLEDSLVSAAAQNTAEAARTTAKANPPIAALGAETAILVLKSSPPFAEAYVDGNYLGVTPVRLEGLPTGRHRVFLKVRRSPAFDTLLTLNPGLQELKFRLEERVPSRLAGKPEDGP
ncbi:MAG: serine/threonine-protein kinase [Fibrobacteria bacterium]